MKLLKKVLCKYETEIYHNMTKKEWKQYKQTENENLSGTLIWGSALLLIFEAWENLSKQKLLKREPFVDFVWDMIAAVIGFILAGG